MESIGLRVENTYFSYKFSKNRGKGGGGFADRFEKSSFLRFPLPSCGTIFPLLSPTNIVECLAELRTMNGIPAEF